MVYSFEGDGLPAGLHTEDSRAFLSHRHFKDGETSLCWSLNGKGRERLSFYGDVGYEPFVSRGDSQNRDHFVAWVYLEEPLAASLKLSFLKDGAWCCGFSFGLSFKGFRTCWVPYEDMEGKPLKGMDQLVFSLEWREEGGASFYGLQRVRAKTAEAADELLGSSCIYLDQIITAVPIDPRHGVRDLQVPFVNLKSDQAVNAHWTSLYRFSQLLLKGLAPIGTRLTGGRLKEASSVECRFQKHLLSHSPFPSPGSAVLLEDEYLECCRKFSRYQIKEEGGVIRGVTVDAACQKAAYPVHLKEWLLELTASIDIKEASELMLEAAYAFHAGSQVQRRTLGNHFNQLFRHLLDQGFAWGSGMGTTHHLGYPMRHFYSALFLMRDCLKAAGLKEEAAKAMAWFSGSGRMFRDDEELSKGESMDVLNTLLQGILASVLMMDDEGRKYHCLKAMGNWLSISLCPTPGLNGPFKWDGSVFHHCGHYPAYAMGGLTGALPVVYSMSQTSFRLGEKAHETMRICLLAMRFYCNRYQWPISMSARHPVGQGEMSQISSLEPFYYMAMAGTPDGKEAVDGQMAKALLRLGEFTDFKRAKELEDMGFQPEEEPHGHVSMNYACASIHRREGWMSAVRGHSRYLWGSEIYEGNNRYGRYVTYGHLEILGSGHPVNQKDSGFYQEGWDFNHFPGTTAPVLPFEKLRARVTVVDPTAGMEEMLLSDQAFAGGVVMDGRMGAFGMKLHGHGKYDGSFWAYKSWFFFDNRIFCLGRGIRDGFWDGPVRTTLYQHYLGAAAKEQDLSPEPRIRERTKEGGRWLFDPSGNWYYLPGGQELTVIRSMQESRAQDTGKPTWGAFEKAWIDHGVLPKDGHYEYLILVQPGYGPEGTGTDRCRLIHGDMRLHQVLDVETGIMAYVFFEAGKAVPTKDGHVLEVSSPCLIMERTTENGWCIAICDPDLRLYEGVEEDQLNEDGSQREVSLYSRKWRDHKSVGRWTQIRFTGNLVPVKEQDGVLFETLYGETRLWVYLVDGRTVQVETYNGLDGPSS